MNTLPIWEGVLILTSELFLGHGDHQIAVYLVLVAIYLRLKAHSD